MFHQRLRRDLGHILHWADEVPRAITGRVHRIAHPIPVRRGPSLIRLFLAGVAVVAFAKLMTAAHGQRRSTTEKLALGVLLLAAAAFVRSMRRSARRHSL